MGCLKGIFRLIIVILVIYAFFFFNGPQAIKERFDSYTNPPREVLIKEEKDFGNLAYVSEEYTFRRSVTIGKYRKITATNKPTGQKISLIDLGDTTTINQADFYSTKIDLKLYQLMDTVKNSPIGLRDIEITQRGTILAKGKIVPYVHFKANIKGIPFVKVTGTIAAYKIGRAHV